MKNIFLFIAFVSFLIKGNTQSNRPYAVWEDQTLSVYKFVRMDASTGIKTDISTIPGMTAFLSGNNTAIDFHNNFYHVAGMSGGITKRLYTIDISTGNMIYNPVFTDNIIGIEFNCNDTLLYALKEVSNTYSLVTIDPVTATTTTIANITGMAGYVGGSFSLDINQGLYSFVALAGSYRLRSFDIQTGAMVNNNVFPDNVSAHRYNCEDGYVYGMWEDNNVYKLEKIDINSGIHVTVDTLAGVTPGYVTESQSVNSSGQYTFRGFDSNNDYALFAVDLSTGSIINSNLTTENAIGFEEASCCNIITTFIYESSIHKPITIFPNPANEIIYFENLSSYVKIECYDLTGNKINFQMNNNTIDVSGFRNGVYILKTFSGENVNYLKVIIVH